jgi:chlorophyll synthase
MTLNDFKALEGDRAMGIRSLPATLGPARAARIACWTMAVPQMAVIALMFAWNRPWFGVAIALLLMAQAGAMAVLLTDPKGRAPWYNATGVSLYVTGMMVTAFAIKGLL